MCLFSYLDNDRIDVSSPLVTKYGRRNDASLMRENLSERDRENKKRNKDRAGLELMKCGINRSSL